mmetsp:Transcript_58833/g.122923  ORF Transcript_58833/g.122923 Transcript_58833/m.122923 type:complete len:158 (-) Transcript_58833:279-752(-)
MQRREPRIMAGKRFFLKALERRKVLAISSGMNIMTVMDAVLAVLDDDKCLKRTGMQLVQLLFATALLSSNVLPSSYISPDAKMPNIDESSWQVSGSVDQFMDLFRFCRDDLVAIMANLDLVDEQSGKYKMFSCPFSKNSSKCRFIAQDSCNEDLKSI